MVVNTDETVTAYGFVFKKKKQAAPFLLSLEDATKITPDEATSFSHGKANKQLVLAQRSSEDALVRTKEAGGSVSWRHGEKARAQRRKSTQARQSRSLLSTSHTPAPPFEHCQLPETTTAAAVEPPTETAQAPSKVDNSEAVARLRQTVSELNNKVWARGQHRGSAALCFLASQASSCLGCLCLGGASWGCSVPLLTCSPLPITAPQLAEARLQAAKTESDLLGTQLGKSVAERDAAAARQELESVRKQMALAAADMSAELARMRSDMADEGNRAVLKELALIKRGLAALNQVRSGGRGGSSSQP